ncbi:cytochrome P450 71A1-like [Panicum virgatum]|uniref:Cytochrome P450 71A1 n=1 Tax=Panicum virgatum TaxID=38727 RepID=A0A8T0V6U6_PANVG|nr:cytochrome P450 71A1-like [Panicum virgatum]XP_039841427.1 cytochrome P450 71A1-like [Panicum virgatum]KAG2626392.1 hypothetical protein PVAP13_3KG352400 [Panicum virgatum]KAG2628593.1 hypothetical protein PVAP13_3KG249581 [Panicum virgatum]
MAPPQLDSNLALFLLFAAPCFVIVGRLLHRRPRRSNCGRVLPPSPLGLPIIGNMHQLGRGHHHRKLQALARRHGDIFLLRLGSVPALVVSSASVAEEVLKNQDHVFCGRPQQRTACGILYGCRDVGFSPYGERWRQLRRIAIVHLLGAKRVDSLRALREEEVASLVARVRAATGTSDDSRGKLRAVNLSELIVSLTYTVISKAAFGNKLGGMDPGSFRAMMKEVTDLLETVAVSDMFPRLRWVDLATGLDAKMRRVAGKLDDVLERALQEHERKPEDEDEAADLLDDLLLVIKEGGEGLNLDRIDVKGLILDLFIGGIDTTSKAIEWAMAYLIKNPREMARVQEEVRQVAGAQGVLEEHLGRMSRPQAALKEAMRLHPPVPLLIPRETIQDTKLHGYDIPAKTRVIINAWAIGRDNESWENAEEFLPDRFVRNAIDYNGKDFRFIPFSSGRRGCPGIAFATRLAELALANLMCHFDWELPEGQDVESFEVVESSGLSPALKFGLILVAKPPRA